MIPYSFLDLAPIPEGGSAAEALGNSVDLARHAERLGYRRYWVAEHHNMPGIASSATAVVIGHLASHTSTIRVGSGGIMLPNHAPLMVAEAFGTLATLFPGRIDLGVGRAPGTDMATARALRRYGEGADTFPDDVVDLLAFLDPARPGQRVRAIPGHGTRVPVWMLGSSTFGAELAGVLGLPYAFASHFAPALLDEAFARYRAVFQPSQWLARPYAMMAVNVYAAATDAEGRRLMSSQRQAIAALRSGHPGELPRPAADGDGVDPALRPLVEGMLAVSAVGAPETVRREFAGLLARHRPDELMIASAIHDHAARVRSLEIAAEALAALPVAGLSRQRDREAASLAAGSA